MVILIMKFFNCIVMCGCVLILKVRGDIFLVIFFCIVRDLRKEGMEILGCDLNLLKIFLWFFLFMVIICWYWFVSIFFYLVWWVKF